ncbi:hypothetical protein ACRAWG_16195 [Methylobacterium sp. P31]
MRKVISCAADVNATEVQIKAACVGADVLAQYQHLAMSLRQKAREEAAAMANTADTTERAAHQCAFQLYETAASELDDLITDLLGNFDRPPTKTVRPPALLVLEGAKPIDSRDTSCA